MSAQPLRGRRSWIHTLCLSFRGLWARKAPPEPLVSAVSRWVRSAPREPRWASRAGEGPPLGSLWVLTRCVLVCRAGRAAWETLACLAPKASEAAWATG